jgi:hypothetical protein
VNAVICRACGEQFVRRHPTQNYCDGCRDGRRKASKEDAPAVHAFICPDGRVYVGSTRHIRARARFGLKRDGYRIFEAEAQFPPNTWRFEVLELLPPECSKQELLEAEQRHMDRLGALNPEFGFNWAPAIRKGWRNPDTYLRAWLWPQLKPEARLAKKRASASTTTLP